MPFTQIELEMSEDGFAAREIKLIDLYQAARREGDQVRARELWELYKDQKQWHREWRAEQALASKSKT
jgi:hypothetical protein